MGLGIGNFWLLPLAIAGTSAEASVVDQAYLPAPEIAVHASELIEPLAIGDSAEVPFSDIQFQVERRVIIRITPLSRVSPAPTVSVPTVEAQRRRPDRGGERCIPIRDIAGVKLGEGRDLLLYMRDKRVIGTKLDRSCQVSGFYSGFYVERPADGMLCAGREALHARSGADCMLSSFHEIGTHDGK